MAYRIRKFLVSSSYVLLAVLTVSAIFGVLPYSRASVFAALSAAWFLVTVAQVPHLLERFEDRLLRRMILVPTVLGSLLALASLVFNISSNFALGVALVAVVELSVWYVLWKRYQGRLAEHDTVGSGYLPGDVWLNPPLEVIPDGALILTDGRMARRARNAVGHSELVVKDGKGKLQVSSSYIEKGVVIHTLRAFIAMERKSKENYIVLVLRERLSTEQSARAFEIAASMLKDNKAWRDRENERRTWLFNMVPIARLRALLFKYAMSTGYDPLGKYWGGERRSRYTCMAANLHVLRGAGVPVGEYGTGAFGLFGEINPLLPVRFMKDPAYRVLTTTDQRAFQSAQAPIAVPAS